MKCPRSRETRGRWSRKALAGLAAVSVLAAAPAHAGSVRVVSIKPSAADPAVQDFDEPSYVLAPDDAPANAPLLVFLTGTGGKPRGLVKFLSLEAGQGFRAIGLEYNDLPAVSEVCPQSPDPGCAEAFRAMRVDGLEGSTIVHNPVAESIVARLTAALRVLARDDPTGGWARYLDGDTPRWDDIVVSGLSQGAGMAAYIAKHHRVRRVVLFSSPWDFTGPERRPAPWLSAPAETPVERWYAEYHSKESTAGLIRRAYTALRIPADHVRVFDRDLAPDAAKGANPYHINTIRDVRYADDWRFLFGPADQTAAP